LHNEAGILFIFKSILISKYEGTSKNVEFGKSTTGIEYTDDLNY